MAGAAAVYCLPALLQLGLKLRWAVGVLVWGHAEVAGSTGDGITTTPTLQHREAVQKHEATE